MKFNSMCAASVLAFSLFAPQFSAHALGSYMQTAQSSNGLSFWIYFPSDKIYTNTETGALICSEDKIDYESANIGLKKVDGSTISSPFKPVKTLTASCAQINLISFYTSGRWDLTVKFDQQGDQVVFPLNVEPIENADPLIQTISDAGDGGTARNSGSHATFRYIKDQNTNQIKSGTFCANEMAELDTAVLYVVQEDPRHLTLNRQPGICTEITDINFGWAGRLLATLKSGETFLFELLP